MGQVKIDYIQRKVVNGREYFYYRKDGLYTRMPHPDSPEFSIKLAKLNNTKKYSKFMAGTLGELVRNYQNSPEFKALAKDTQKGRNWVFSKLSKEDLNQMVVMLRRRDIKALRDRFQETPGNANNCLSALSALMTYAVDNEWRETNPADGIKRLKLGSIDPWPESVISDAMDKADDTLKLAIALGLYTGQRIGDIVNMKHNDRENGFIKVKQSKTGKELVIREHSMLACMLDGAEKKAITMLHNKYGKVMTVRTLQRNLASLLAYIGAEGYSFHGLRKNAVNALLEAGCTVPQVSAVTGQSYKVVEYYAAKIDQPKMTTAAILRIDQNGRKT